MINENDWLKGKTIVNAEVDGFQVKLIFSDGTAFLYEASDGGYSSFHAFETVKEMEEW